MTWFSPGSWTLMASDVETIVGESMLGHKMFGFALELITVDRWEKQLDDIMQDMKVGEINKDQLQTCMGPEFVYTCLSWWFTHRSPKYVRFIHAYPMLALCPRRCCEA